MHYYKRNIGDYAKKAGRLSIMQHGTYTLLIDACYDREQFPTLEQAIEWVWASTTEEIEALKFVLSRFFVLENGVYSQKRIREEIDEYHKKAETNKRIALEREAKRRGNSTNRAPVVNEPPPNHKPITNNHKPVLKDKSAAAPILPNWMPLDAWSGYVEMRKRIKKPMTDRAVDLKIKDLDKFKQSGHDIAAILDKSTANNWTDLYEPKPMQQNNGHINKQEALEASNRAVVERLLAKEAQYAPQ
jgi:uncharacterized protein YdaU (DUF1376 family)